MILRDYPAIGRSGNNWNLEASERTHWLKLASRHLSSFKKWKESHPIFSNVAPLGAASLYCRSHGLPSRAQLTNTLAQLYEQRVLSEFHPYVPHLNPSRPVTLFLSKVFGSGRRKKVSLPTLGA